jgi:phosphoserine phosphatase RsbU/P
MTDRSISIKSDPASKPLSRLAAGSLAQRVLFMTIVLVGLPLLIHTFLLYHREYRENIDDALLTMRSLAESRALYMEQMVQNQLTILGALSDDFPESRLGQNEFLKSEAKEHGVDQIFYVTFDSDQKPVCEELFCRDPSILPAMQQLIQNKTLFFINRNAEDHNEWLYVGKMIGSSGSVQRALLIATPADRILTRLAYREYSPYPLRLSFVDASGNIFLSSEKGIEGKHFAQSSEEFSWVPQANQPNSWVLKTARGSFLAVKIPIEETNYTLMLDVSEQSIANLQMKDYFFRIATLLFFVCVVGGGILIWLTHRISRPLQSLCAVMKRIAQGANHARFTEDKMGFEINVLGRQMNQMLDALLLHQQEAEREKMARERLAQELRIGHQIQASMLPVDLPDFPSLKIAPGYLSAREVSGDFYDFFVLDDGRLMIAIADAADKGISACLFSLSFRSMLRTAAAILKDLSATASMANTLFMLDTAATSFFITAWIGIYDPLTRELSYCSQGHPPAYVRKKNGKLIELQASGMALGVEIIQPKIELIRLDEGDLLFLYTDGVIEAVDTDHQFFGKERLKEFLLRSRKNEPHAIVDRLLEEIHLFSGGASQADDLTLLAIGLI